MNKHIASLLFVMLFSITAQAQNGWNLKLATQPGLTKAIAQSQIQPFYDERDTDSNLDGIEERPVKRDINDPCFFQTPTGIYAVVVVQNTGRKAPKASGWCDAWLFERKSDQWLIAGRKLMAGGGGTNGQPGEFKELLRTGRNSVGVVITGGGNLMGHSFSFHNIVTIENGKISPAKKTFIATYINNGGDDANPRCEKNAYKFIPSQKENYDLQIVTTDCTDTKKPRKTDSVTVPYLHKQYTIPDNFRFELQHNGN